MADLSQRLTFMHHEVAASRQETLSLSITLAGMISYLELVWILLPYNAAPLHVPISMVLLGGSAILSYMLLRQRRLILSSQVLAWGSVTSHG